MNSLLWVRNYKRTYRNNTLKNNSKFLIFVLLIDSSIFRVTRLRKRKRERDSKYNVFLYTLPLYSSRGYSYIKDFTKEHDKFSSQSRGNISQSTFTKLNKEIFSESFLGYIMVMHGRYIYTHIYMYIYIF